jgi:NAD+ diphosphatase
MASLSVARLRKAQPRATTGNTLRDHTMSFDLGPKPRLGYVDNPLDRVSERRGDPGWIEALAARADARFTPVAGELIPLSRAADGRLTALFDRATADTLGAPRDTVCLGLDGVAGRFGLSLDPATGEALKARDDLVVTDLRSVAIQGLVPPDELSIIAEAKALLHWHERHRFCASCGQPTRQAQGGWKRECAACKAEHFPRTDPVVIMLAHDGDRCLMGRQTRFPPGMYSCLAGFLEPGETIEAAVRRETQEEAGILCDQVRIHSNQPWPFPMSLMIGCHARATTRDIVMDRAELEDCRWFTREDAALMLMRAHPARLTTPPPVAIAHHLIRAWVEGEV